MTAATVAHLSPEGVEMEDWYGSRVRLAWRHVERIDVVGSRIPSPRTITKAGRIGVRTGARQCIGLVGWGEYEIPHNAPDWLLAHRSGIGATENQHPPRRCRSPVGTRPDGRPGPPAHA
ncbi:hypothetical protein GCM10022224_097770 [Nonomuraea antimicrobica]|uniref:Uncharacterized protein n=1 Tax=Nonomuraea antimicrobica TaxID=561173 RepID=A0ABP7ECL1_9ACTN